MDKRELAYFDFKLADRHKANPDLDIKEEMMKRIIANMDFDASNNDGMYLKTINEVIPNRIIDIMRDQMTDLKTTYRITKYGLFRACEDYVCKTDWFFSLTRKNQRAIRFDFYKYIILGLNDAFTRINNLNKNRR